MSERDLFGEGLPEQPQPRLPIADISAADFVPDDDGIPRIDDWRLGELLGKDVRELHQSSLRHCEYLVLFGNISKRLINSGGRGRPGIHERYSFGQAQFLTVTTRGSGWQAVLVHIIQIWEMWKDGKLVARDAAAEAKAESSMAKATEAAPEIMRTFLSETFRRWEQTMREEIKDAVNENMRMPKMEFTDATKLAICKEWRRQNPTGLDLLCRDEIVDEQDQPIRGVCEIHHMKGIYRNSIEDGLPVPVWFHRKLTADRTENGPEWQQARNAHRVFLDRYRANKTRDIFDA